MTWIIHERHVRVETSWSRQQICHGLTDSCRVSKSLLSVSPRLRRPTVERRLFEASSAVSLDLISYFSDSVTMECHTLLIRLLRSLGPGWGYPSHSFTLLHRYIVPVRSLPHSNYQFKNQVMSYFVSKIFKPSFGTCVLKLQLLRTQNTLNCTFETHFCLSFDVKKKLDIYLI